MAKCLPFIISPKLYAARLRVLSLSELQINSTKADIATGLSLSIFPKLSAAWYRVDSS